MMINELDFSETGYRHNSERRIQEIFNEIDIGISLINKNGRLIYPKLYVVGKGVTRSALDPETGWDETYLLQGKDLRVTNRGDYLFTGGRMITTKKPKSSHSKFFRENFPYLSVMNNGRSYHFPFMGFRDFIQLR
jgi:hypothetical protein